MSLNDPMHWILDADLREVPCPYVLAWASWFEHNHRLRIVAQEYVGQAFVSTVFLGLDHNYALQGNPLLYETMIFSPNDHDPELVCRYSTWTQANQGHHNTVTSLKAKLT